MNLENFGVSSRNRALGHSAALTLVTGALIMSCASGGSSAAKEPDVLPNDTGSPQPERGGSRPGASASAGKREIEDAKRLANADDLPGAIAKVKEAIAKNPGLEEAYLLLGSSCAMTEDAACEKQAYVDGMKALPSSAAIVSQMGLLELRLGDAKSAIERLERALALSGSKDAKIMADLAFAYTFVGRIDDAVRMANKARETDPRSFEAAMSLGEVLLRKKDGSGAAAAFEAALQRTDDAEVKRNVTRQLAIANMMDGKHERALELLRSLVAGADPKDAMLRAQIASNLISLHREKEAVAEMEAAVKAAPEDTRFLQLLLQAQEKAKDKRGAEETRKRLTALGVKP